MAKEWNKYYEKKIKFEGKVPIHYPKIAINLPMTY